LQGGHVLVESGLCPFGTFGGAPGGRLGGAGGGVALIEFCTQAGALLAGGVQFGPLGGEGGTDAVPLVGDRAQAGGGGGQVLP
jgi:hypothetical protein